MSKFLSLSAVVLPCLLGWTASASASAKQQQLSSSPCRSNPQNHAADCEFLEDLYRATGGAEGRWTNSSNWNSSASVCDWFGVFCDGGARANRTELPGNGLHGTVPASIADMQLFGFDVGGNEIVGQLPNEIGSVSTLWGIDFVNPAKGFGLQGTIPSSLGSLTRLQLLGLVNNRLTGTLPPSLAALTDLRVMGWSDNDLGGRVSPALCPLVDQVHVCMGQGNHFECPLPRCVAAKCSATCSNSSSS